ncbi:cupin domain-containing protein [Nitrosopumilus ureiphilus]|uniref:Cupin domain-containing protein n=1 Tax=Nitrosopumilus ureiphilus TaxID=1470067 RepID=A0A7D5R1Z0_9ARCH|nr:cupin domain-containing protein [Nitrosopumilus ureiphilus]QLH06996.1 cupin domain-containing protein [Nitrosopumilus ureiphilus]
MALRKNSEIQSIQGNEGTKIKQYFHPHNTLNGINYSVAQFTLEPGKRSKLHKLNSSEIYYILEGSAILNVDEDKHHLQKDDSAYISPNSKQFIENTGSGNLRFLCIVEPAWKAENEVLLE